MSIRKKITLLITIAGFLSITNGLLKGGGNEHANKNYQDRDNLYNCDTLWKEESGKKQDKEDGGLTNHGN